MRRAAWLLFLALTGCLALTGHDGPWPCNTDADCKGSDLCLHDTSARGKVCAAPGSCTQNEDCILNGAMAPLTTCTNGRCGPPTCEADDWCPGSFRCIGGLCAVSCTSDAQCQAGTVCKAGSCGVPPCTSDSQCSGYHCVDGTCLHDCLTNNDCATGYLCSGGACGCQGGCGLFACLGGSCAQSCTSNADCAAGASCGADRACHTCTGYAAPCASQGGYCAYVPGCTYDVTTGCTGTSGSCNGLDGSTCPVVVGCTWM
jgi:Cys-rich repeat protein